MTEKKPLNICLPLCIAALLVIAPFMHLSPLLAGSQEDAPPEDTSTDSAEASEKEVNDLTQAAGQLAAVLTSLREEREAFTREKNSSLLLEENLQSEAQRLRSRLTAVKKAQANRSLLVEKLSSEVKDMDRKKEALLNKIALIRSFVRDGTEEWKNRSLHALPPLREQRTEAWAHFWGKAKRPAEPLLNLCQQFWGLLEEEMEIGEGRAITAGEVVFPDGRRVSGRILRLGKVFCAFQSSRGNDMAVLKREQGTAGPEYTWTQDMGYFSGARLRKAFDVLDKRRPPQFIDLPLHSSWFQDISNAVLEKREAEK